MKKIFRLVGMVFLILISLFGYAVFNELVFDSCGIEEAYAHKRVVGELKTRKLPLNGLTHEKSVGTCIHKYKYKTNSQNIDFVVFSDWLHGVKLNYWDYNDIDNQ